MQYLESVETAYAMSKLIEVNSTVLMEKQWFTILMTSQPITDGFWFWLNQINGNLMMHDFGVKFTFVIALEGKLLGETFYKVSNISSTKWTEISSSMWNSTAMLLGWSDDVSKEMDDFIEITITNVELIDLIVFLVSKYFLPLLVYQTQ